MNASSAIPPRRLGGRAWRWLVAGVADEGAPETSPLLNLISSGLIIDIRAPEYKRGSFWAAPFLVF
jgi:hypothetical protein